MDTRYFLKRPYTLARWQDTPLSFVNGETNVMRKVKPDEIDIALCLDVNKEQDAAGFDGTALSRLVEYGILCTDEESAADGVVHTYDCVKRSTVQLSLTGRCNESCRHCLAAAGMKASADELSLAECERLFDQMLECGIRKVMFTGGEPLLRRDLFDIAQAAVDRGISIDRIYTNAILLDDRFLERMGELGQNPCYYISFDGLGTHDWMRNRKGAEAETLAAIDRVVASGGRCLASINVNAKSAPRIIETVRCLVWEHGCTSFHIILTGSSPRWVETSGLKQDCSLEEYFNLMIELIATSRAERWGAYLDIVHVPRLHNIIPENLQELDKLAQVPETGLGQTMPQVFFDARVVALRRIIESYSNPPAAKGCESALLSCSKLAHLVFVARDGRVLPCSGYEGDTARYGKLSSADSNIHNRSLYDILTHSEYIDQFKITIDDIRTQDALCADCRWIGICRGGCACYRFFNQYRDAIRPDCAFFREGFIEEYLDMLGVRQLA